MIYRHVRAIAGEEEKQALRVFDRCTVPARQYVLDATTDA